ncbi:MAG TPA: DUF4097 family beta strand repeat-containing protein [Gemmatimonadales bacterium]|nr:DUF4097 family beta strand repeat-containing protein [Gemmatimonadales bacterium]
MRTAVPVLALCFAVPALAAQASQRYTITGSDAAIYNLAGSVKIGPAGGTAVVVDVTRGGRDAAQLRVDTGAIGSRQTVRVIYPDDDIVYRGGHDRGEWSTTLDVREDGTFGGDEHWGRHGEGRRVRISGDGSGVESWADLAIGVPKGQRVAVYLAVGRVTATNVNGDLRIDVSSADVTAEGSQGPLSVDAGSGDVRVTNAQGSLDLDTGSGDVTVSGATGDDLRIDTGSGDVAVDAVRVNTLNIDTGSGDVTADSVRGDDLKFDTGSGNVRATLVATSSPSLIDIDTGSGNATVTLPPAFGGKVVLDTGSGEIDLGGIAVTVSRLENDHIEGRIGSGTGRLHIETGSGDVRLKKS